MSDGQVFYLDFEYSPEPAQAVKSDASQDGDF